MTIKTFLEAEQHLAAAIDGYEEREPQQRLAAMVEQALADKQHLFGEAGTGTGKSFAYLIPAILSGKRVIVSTGTKALQDQIFQGDLPVLAELLPVRMSYALLKGRSNYVCLNRAQGADNLRSDTFERLSRRTEDEDFDGTREGLGFVVTDQEWWQVCSESDDCSTLGCSREPETDCFATRARRNAQAAQVVVVNHALLFTDLQVKHASGGAASLLGEYDAVIADEAHECFPAGTLVGGRPIEAITVGDLVKAFDPETGAVVDRRVTNLFVNPAPAHMVRVSAGEFSFDATLSHPVLTQDGWKQAVNLVPGDSLLTHAIPTGSSAESTDYDGLHGVRGIVLPAERPSEVELQEALPGVLLSGVQRALEGAAVAGGSGYGRVSGSTDARVESHAAARGAGEDVASLEGATDAREGWQRQANDRTSEDAPGASGRGVGSRSGGDHRSWVATESLQAGSGSQSPYGRSGGRWGGAPSEEGAGSRSPQGILVGAARVDAVEILERGGAGGSDEVCPDGLVYNLEVEGLHTYFANGVAVHNCEEWATKSLGARLTKGSGEFLTIQVEAFANRHGKGDAFALIAQQVQTANTALWEVLDHRNITRSSRMRAQDMVDTQDEFLELVEGLRALYDAITGLTAEGDEKRKAVLRSRLMSLVNRYISAWTDPFTDTVRWLEDEQTRGRNVRTRRVLNTAPVEVGPFLRDTLFADVPVIMVSATLSTGGDFRYVAGRLGCDDYESILVGTPFDYTTQAVTYVPKHLPSPSGRTREEWSEKVITEIEDLVRLSGGGALVLFTSTAQMRAAFTQVNTNLDLECRVQGGGANNQELVAWLKQDSNRVLFATRSFFTGVDFRGDAVRLVIIDKLPFPVPTDPIIEARQEAVERRGENAFSTFVIPYMSLILQQGYGRLIRHRNDRGAVAILDPRLAGSSYGKQILRTLPNAPVVHFHDEVAPLIGEVAPASV